MRDHRGLKHKKRKFKARFVREKPPNRFARRMKRWYWVAAAVDTGCICGVYVAASAFTYAVTQVTLTALPWANLSVFAMMEIAKWVALSSALAPLVPITFVFPLYFIFLRGYFATLVAAYGRCAACGYDIMSITPEPDGCTVCPECEAAWIVQGPAERPRGTIAP